MKKRPSSIIALATAEGYVRFEDGQVRLVPETKDATTFSNWRLVTAEAERHGLQDGYILVDVSRELAEAAAV